MSASRAISVCFGALLVFGVLGCNAANEDEGELFRTASGKADGLDGVSYFRGSTLLAGQAEIKERVAAVGYGSAQGLGLVDQYYFANGKWTDAVKSFCGDKGKSCQVDTTGYQQFSNWFHSRLLVGPYVPAGLSSVPLDASQKGLLDQCRVEHGTCGYAPLSKVFEIETKRLSDVEPAQQERDFKKMMDALATMDTMGGGTAVVALPGGYAYSSFAVDQKLTKKYPSLAAQIECPIPRAGVTCQFTVDVEIVELAVSWGQMKQYKAGAYARKAEIVESPNPNSIGDITYYSFNKSDILSLRLELTEVSVCPVPETVDTVTRGGTWAAYYVSVPGETPGGNVQLQTYSNNMYFIEQAVTPQVPKSKLYVMARGRGLKHLPASTTISALSTARCYSK